MPVTTIEAPSMPEDNSGFRTKKSLDVYHDMAWYPTVGQSSISEFMHTGWGQLLRKY